MYQLKVKDTVVLCRESEQEIYQLGFILAERNPGVELTVWKDDVYRSRFAIIPGKATKRVYSEQAIAVLNGGPQIENVGEYVLRALPTEGLHWSEIH
jgi:hypothetical protein